FVLSGDTADLAIIPDAKCKPKKLWRESNGGLFDFLQKSTCGEMLKNLPRLYAIAAFRENTFPGARAGKREIIERILRHPAIKKWTGS
ncbi:MAG: hypothetical protein LBT97_14075, partial [Planctomycetota bacterium]|nr:hypothetical protein [Planctomycetota bacterium]